MAAMDVDDWDDGGTDGVDRTTVRTNTPWVEKYRPKSLGDVSHQKEVVATLQNAVESGRLPHLLLYGPPGTGKTSVALALCHTLWPPEDYKKRVLELNASDERGISVVRDKIKHFASLAVGDASAASRPSKTAMSSFWQPKKKTKTSDSEEKGEGDGTAGKPESAVAEVAAKKYPNPPFKIIILDEADTVTPDAQAALRRVIEAHSRITRFILICNYVTRIIEPLASRCAKFRFQSLPPASMKARLQHICRQEGCRLSDDTVLEEVLRLSGGDMRRAVTTLQSAHLLSKARPDATIPKDCILEIMGLAPASLLDEVFAALRKDPAREEDAFSSMQQKVEDIMAEGYAVPEILVELSQRLIAASDLTDLGKAVVSIRIAQAEKELNDGADEMLQLLTVCSLIQQQYATNVNDNS